MAVFFAVAFDHCVDDMATVERLLTILSAWESWRGFAALAGWDVPDAKSPMPVGELAQRFVLLGGLINLSGPPNEPALISLPVE